MWFTLAALFGMYFGRKLGWALSKYVLYTATTGLVVVACVIWGALIALGIHSLIVWQQPNLLLKIIFGFGLGAYVSVPNYGLFSEATMPDHAAQRHTLISSVPLLAFIFASAGLAFLR